MASVYEAAGSGARSDARRENSRTAEGFSVNVPNHVRCDRVVSVIARAVHCRPRHRAQASHLRHRARISNHMTSGVSAQVNMDAVGTL